MSLRTLGIMGPLEAEHPAVGEPCWKCGKKMAPGMRVGLAPIETTTQTGSLTVECKLVCATCHLRGVEIMTEGGPRIVERVKDGDASPFPVLTTDGLQWAEREVDKL